MSIRYNSEMREKIKTALGYMLYSKACKMLIETSHAINEAVYNAHFSAKAQKIMHSNIFTAESWETTDTMSTNQPYSFRAIILYYEIDDFLISRQFCSTNDFGGDKLIPMAYEFVMSDEHKKLKDNFNKGVRLTKQKIDIFDAEVFKALKSSNSSKNFRHTDFFSKNPLVHPILDAAEYYATNEQATPFIEGGADLFEVTINFKEQLKGLNLS